MSSAMKNAIVLTLVILLLPSLAVAAGGGGWAKLAEFTTDPDQRLAKVESNAPLEQARFYRIQLAD